MSCCNITPLKELELVSALRYSDVIQENRQIGRNAGAPAEIWLPGLVLSFQTNFGAYEAWNGELPTGTESLAILACCHEWEESTLQANANANLIIGGTVNLNALYLKDDPSAKLTTVQQDYLRNYSIVVKNQRDNAVTIGA